MEFVSKTDVGIKRTNNEDFLFAENLNDNISLFIVADGLGGYASGEVASHMVVEILNDLIKKDIEVLENSVDEEIYAKIKEYISIANNKIYEKQINEPEHKGMGTTIVSVLKIKDVIYYFSIGDSRLYYITENMNDIIQVTIDDTYVNELLKTGAITEEEALNHSQKHVLTKAIGVVENISLTINKLNKNDGYLVLCSDGVTNMLSDDDILDIVKTSSFKYVANNIVNNANSNGGVDNITVVVVKI